MASVRTALPPTTQAAICSRCRCASSAPSSTPSSSPRSRHGSSAPLRLVGRAAELRALGARLAGGARRLALVGGGGSGKSLLACALGHRLRRRYPGGVHWLRVGGWDASTLLEMLARRLGAAGPDR